MTATSWLRPTSGVRGMGRGAGKLVSLSGRDGETSQVETVQTTIRAPSLGLIPNVHGGAMRDRRPARVPGEAERDAAASVRDKRRRLHIPKRQFAPCSRIYAQARSSNPPAPETTAPRTAHSSILDTPALRRSRRIGPLPTLHIGRSMGQERTPQSSSAHKCPRREASDERHPRHGRHARLRPGRPGATTLRRLGVARACPATARAQARGVFNLDAFRYGIEQMAPADYLEASYFERWLTTVEYNLVQAGVLTEAEVTSGWTAPPGPRFQAAARTAPGTGNHIPEPPPAQPAPRFAEGDAVITRNLHPSRPYPAPALRARQARGDQPCLRQRSPAGHQRARTGRASADGLQRPLRRPRLWGDGRAKPDCRDRPLGVLSGTSRDLSGDGGGSWHTIPSRNHTSRCAQRRSNRS